MADPAGSSFSPTGMALKVASAVPCQRCPLCRAASPRQHVGCPAQSGVSRSSAPSSHLLTTQRSIVVTRASPSPSLAQSVQPTDFFFLEINYLPSRAQQEGLQVRLSTATLSDAEELLQSHTGRGLQVGRAARRSSEGSSTGSASPRPSTHPSQRGGEETHRPPC